MESEGKIRKSSIELFPDTKEDGNNTFLYLFNMATMTSLVKNDNTESKANWAKQQLVNAFEAKNQYDLAEFDHYISGLLITLDLNVFNIPKTGKISTASKVMKSARGTEVGVLGELKLAELVG